MSLGITQLPKLNVASSILATRSNLSDRLSRRVAPSQRPRGDRTDIRNVALRRLVGFSGDRLVQSLYRRRLSDDRTLALMIGQAV